MRMLALAGIACVLLTQAPVHAAGSSSVEARICVGSSPRAIVRSYYTAINHHEAARAQACLTPYFKAQAASFIDPDWKNIVYVRQLHLRSESVSDKGLPGNVPPQDSHPFAAAQVTARFIVHYYRVVESPNGITIRFIYAVQQHERSPWRIAAIGSGP